MERDYTMIRRSNAMQKKQKVYILAKGRGQNCNFPPLSIAHELKQVAQDWNTFLHPTEHSWASRFIPIVISIDKDSEVHTHTRGSRRVRGDERGHSCF